MTSTARKPDWAPDAQLGPGPQRMCPHLWERSIGHDGGTSGQGDEPRETGRRESECLVVPLRAGNRPTGTRWREGGTEP